MADAAVTRARVPFVLISAVVLMALLMLGVGARPAFADTACVVNSLADTDGTGASCQTTANDGTVTLRSAFHRSVTAGGTNTITFANTITLPGTITLAGGVFDLPAANNLAVTGPGARLLTIDAQAASRIFAVESGATLSISGMTLTNGTTAENTGGGALVNHGTASADRVAFLTNHVTSGNGGAVATNGTMLTITNSLLSGNVADLNTGGGMYLIGNALISNTTITGNSARNGGGGISSYTGNAAIVANFVNVTVEGNHRTGNGFPQDGGGIVLSGAETMGFKNSIFSNNTPFNCGIEGGTPILADNGYNLDSGVTCQFANQALNTTDPQLTALANNGGPTDTEALQATSPAVGSAGPGCPATDQRGQARNVDTHCDRGAFELAAPTVTQVSPACGPVGTTVTVTGSGFTGAIAVKFGLTAATFNVVSDSRLTATTPAGSGIVDIAVTNSDGTSATVTADRFAEGACPTALIAPIGLPKAGAGSADGSGRSWYLPLLVGVAILVGPLALVVRRASREG